MQNTVTDGYFKSKGKQRGGEGALSFQTVRAQYLPNFSEELPREQGKKKKKKCSLVIFVFLLNAGLPEANKS